MATCAWNMAKWMRATILFLFAQLLSLKITINRAKQEVIHYLKSIGLILENRVVSEDFA